MERNEIFDKLSEILTLAGGESVEGLSEQTELKRDLGLNSVNVLYLVIAIEEMFGVKVEKVNTVNMKAKPKRMGVHAGTTRTWKKAIVILTEDSKTIAFFDSLN